MESLFGCFVPVTLTDVNFADDTYLLSNEMEQAQQLLRQVETECKK